MLTYDDVKKARYLRQESTKEEKIIWEFIRGRNLGVKFRRQHPIDIFVIDFYCTEIKLAIELDGGGHATEEGKEYDESRTKFLQSRGIEVLRFWNSEIEKDLESVLKKIESEINRLKAN